MPAGVSHERLERRRTHERGRGLGVHTLAAAIFTSALAVPDVVEQR